MTATGIINEPSLPWTETPEDRRFRRLTFTLLVIFMCLGLVTNMITLPEPDQRKLIDISPRLAKLILEKKKVKPPEPKIEKPKVEKKKEPEKKKEVKKKEEPKVKPVPTAREKAQKSGLIALSDELADLRDSFALDDTLDQPQQTSGKKALDVATNTAILSTQAKQTSGGITTSNLTRKVESTELVSRKTTSVTSTIPSSSQTKKKVARASGKTTGRSEEEIERVFQKNKGGIFAIYNRALRKDPTLQGKIVLELTIEPNGVVSKVTIVSSELNDKKLEKKLVLKIRKFKFARANVAKTTVTYPIDFLPS